MRIRTEPQELDNPVNGELDRIEDAIRSVVARGGEAPLRARLARLLGNGAPGASDRPAALGSVSGADLAPAVKVFAALYAKRPNGAQAYADAFPGLEPDSTKRSERARVLLRRPAVAALVAKLGGDPGPRTTQRRRDGAVDVDEVAGAELERLGRIIAAAAGKLPLRITVECVPADVLKTSGGAAQ